MKYITRSAKETQKLAARLARASKGGEVIGLIGNLGGGKTTFVQGFGRALGADQHINSPSFVLMNLYQLPARRGRRAQLRWLVHFDAYRLSHDHQEALAGLTEYLHRPDCVVLIEWVDRLGKLAGCDTIIRFEVKEEDSRQITVNSRDDFDVQQLMS